jgi:GNAT superfamily N-acetyltransferase
VTIVVRPATVDDLTAYTLMGEAFIGASPLGALVGEDPQATATFITGAMQNPNIGMWIAERDGLPVGICSAIAYPLYFRPSHTIVQELWWWLTPEARGSGAGQMMFKEIELWAASKNATAMFMIALDDENVDKVSKFYRRAGFRPMERTFAKGLR